jgi:hypothetical protein
MMNLRLLKIKVEYLMENNEDEDVELETIGDDE